jgi:TrmH family RNA methyltransferase
MNLFLIEGYRELIRATNAGWICEALFLCPELFLGTHEQSLIETIEKNGTDIFDCSKEIFEKISYRDRSDGLLAVAKKKQMDIAELKRACSSIPFLIVAESIEKPGNLGSILRSSDAVGCDAAIICDACTDIFNPNVVRSSVGTLFTQPVIEATSSSLISFLKEKRISIVATSPDAETAYTQADLSGPVAIVVGTEQYGLSKQWLDQCDITVSIPMHGIADSLNVSTATTLLLYEVLRQRRKI